jgi:hypothetical protein
MAYNRGYGTPEEIVSVCIQPRDARPLPAQPGFSYERR